MSDPANYRTKEEVEKVRQEHDPIETFRQYLLSKKVATEDALKSVEKQVKDIVAESATFAQESPEPDVAELYTDILI